MTPCPETGIPRTRRPPRYMPGQAAPVLRKAPNAKHSVPVVDGRFISPGVFACQQPCESFLTVPFLLGTWPFGRSGKRILPHCRHSAGQSIAGTARLWRAAGSARGRGVDWCTPRQPGGPAHPVVFGAVPTSRGAPTLAPGRHPRRGEGVDGPRSHHPQGMRRLSPWPSGWA